MSAPTPRDPLGRWLILLACVVVAVAVAAAILVGGTPSERRAMRLDDRRVSDLMRLSEAIDAYWTREKRLPGSLQILASQPGLGLQTMDPVTGEPYDYVATGARSYRVCAVFTTDTSRRRDRGHGKWAHGVGRHCFDDTAPEKD